MVFFATNTRIKGEYFAGNYSPLIRVFVAKLIKVIFFEKIELNENLFNSNLILILEAKKMICQTKTTTS